MDWRGWRGCLFVLLAVLLAPRAGWCQFSVTPFERTTPDGPQRGMIATIDLRDPRLEVVVTPASPNPAKPSEIAVELTTTEDFARAHGLHLAINTNFFGWHKVKPFGEPIGLVLADGRVLSPPRSHEGVFDPVLVFLRDGSARVTNVGLENLRRYRHGVAGIGPTAKEPGTLLVHGGRNLGATARVQPGVRHPRTAAGVDASGRRLVLVVVDGRQPGWSVGATLPELADLLIEQGVSEGVALDGGGSSTLVYLSPQDGTVLRNRVSGSTARAVSTNLGFRVRGAKADWSAIAPATRPATQSTTQATE